MDNKKSCDAVRSGYGIKFGLSTVLKRIIFDNLIMTFPSHIIRKYYFCINRIVIVEEKTLKFSFNCSSNIFLLQRLKKGPQKLY